MTVHYTVAARVATVRIDRPQVHNALDRATLDGLADAFRRASADDEVGVVVLTGTGERAFCTGADLDEQHAFVQRPNDYWEWMGHFIAAVDAIRGCAKPVVARLNGMVVGGGNELNMACDLAVAADDILFRHVGPSRGSVPAGGATQWMPLLVGERRAREILLLNRPHSAQQALDWGWVNRVVPRDRLDAEVDDLCRELLAKMPEILRATRAQLDFWKDLSWSMTIRHAREWLTIHAASVEVQEGLTSFDEKRPPDYERLWASMTGRADGSGSDVASSSERPAAGAPLSATGAPGAAAADPPAPAASPASDGGSSDGHTPSGQELADAVQARSNEQLAGSPPAADEGPVDQEIHDE